MASSCENCSNCRRNNCGYCNACRNGDICLFRKCKSVAYAFETQLKWQQEACRLVQDYPHLEPLYQIVFHANDVLPEMIDSEERSLHRQKAPGLKTTYDDETSMHGNGTASDDSFATAMASFSEEEEEDIIIKKEDDPYDSKPNRFQCGKCFYCQRGACNACCFCAKRDALTKKSNRCPFLMCETASYSIRFLEDLKIKAQRAVQANPDRLVYLYERLYGESGLLTLQLHTREKERQAILESVKDESNAIGKRIIMLRSRPEPSCVVIKEEDESSIQDKKVPAQSLRKRNISAIVSPDVSNKTQSRGRQGACRTCEGCTRSLCGLCLRCTTSQGFTTSRGCVFRLCDNCDYADSYKAKLTRHVVDALRSTMNKHGISPLQSLADIVMAGPLSANHTISNGCDRSLVSMDVPDTVSSGVLAVEPHKRKRQRILSTSGRIRARACGECAGCTFPECGLCIHCKRMNRYGRRKCVFRVCQECSYTPLTVEKLVGCIRKSLNLTRRKDGSSPLDGFARTAMEGPLASYAPKVIDMTRGDEDETPNIFYVLTKRLSACRTCAGCMTAACGLCIHCKGMDRFGRCRCVFQVCHRADYARSTMKSLFRNIHKSLKLTRRSDGSSPLDSIAKKVLKGPLASYPQTIVNLTGGEENSLISEVVENSVLEDRTCTSIQSDEGIYHEVSKRAFGLPAPGYSLLKGLDWNDDLEDWNGFICSLKTLSSFDRETAIYFHYRQANELPEVSIRDSVETQKLERALIASIFLLAGLPRSPKTTLLEKARHSILLYSLHFENDRRLMTMLTSNRNYQSDLKQILKSPRMHELEPREFVSLILEL